MCPTPPSPDWLPLATFTVQTGTLIGAAAVAVAALWQAATARKRHQEQTTADRERRITESFAKAVEQLGSDKLETRLGGIYTLERIARESAREYWPIMETLTAFVREHAPWPPRQAFTHPFVELQGKVGDKAAGDSTPPEQPEKERRTAAPPPTDIQAALTVLGRRDAAAREQDKATERRLDLRATDLQLASLPGAHLEYADLRAAHLEWANLRGAHLEYADLRLAHLVCADLSNADMSGALFKGAHLEWASLQGACLEHASLQEAHLKDTLMPNGHRSSSVEALERISLQRASLRDALTTLDDQPDAPDNPGSSRNGIMEKPAEGSGE